LGKFASEAVGSEEQRWLKFFKEGDRLGVDRLPDRVETVEMRQAMSALKAFSEKDNACYTNQAHQSFLRVQGAFAGYSPASYPIPPSRLSP
jgi:hypothetical protein